MKGVSAVILAGGLSSRMNYPKAFLPFDYPETFLSKIVAAYLDWGCEDIIIVIQHSLNNDTLSELSKYGNRKQFIKVIANHNPELDRFHSIQLGLSGIRRGNISFLQNVDNPFVNQETLSALAGNFIANGYCIPIFNKKGGHPILLGKLVINGILRYRQGAARLNTFLLNFSCQKIEVDDDSIHVNINTPADYMSHFPHHRQSLFLKISSIENINPVPSP